MRTYEALYIASAELDEDGIQTVVGEVDNLVTSNGGTIVRSENWGKRKLAYEVKKQTEGNYTLLRFQAEPEFIDRLENHFRLNDSIFRFLVVHFDEHTLRLEEEQERRRKEEVTRGARREDDDDDDDDRDDRPRRRRDEDDD